MTRDPSADDVLPPGYRIRPADPADADPLRRFGAQLLAETEFFLRGPEERARDTAEMAGVIRSFARIDGALMLNGWYRDPAVPPEAPADTGDGGEVPVAEAVMIPGRLHRTRAVATVGVGVLQAHWGRGLARALMRRIEAAARAAGHRRLELSVFAPNMRARRLYEGLGYDHEGVKRRSVDLPSHGPVDEWLMAKLL